jgi:hypothetical protein
MTGLHFTAKEMNVKDDKAPHWKNPKVFLVVPCKRTLDEMANVSFNQKKIFTELYYYKEHLDATKDSRSFVLCCCFTSDIVNVELRFGNYDPNFWDDFKLWYTRKESGGC